MKREKNITKNIICWMSKMYNKSLETNQKPAQEKRGLDNQSFTCKEKVACPHYFLMMVLVVQKVKSLALIPKVILC